MKNIKDYALAIGGIILLVLFIIFIWKMKWLILTTVIVLGTVFAIYETLYEKATGQHSRLYEWVDKQ